MDQNSPFRKVLIVDDEIEIREILIEILLPTGFRLETATHGKEALEKIRETYFDSVVCDIMMPEMTGTECFIKAHTAGIFTPFVFVTGFGDQNRILEALRLGAVDFIHKPFHPQTVLDTVIKSVDMGSRKRSLHQCLQSKYPEIHRQVVNDEKMNNLMRAVNNKKRVA